MELKTYGGIKNKSYLKNDMGVILDFWTSNFTFSFPSYCTVWLQPSTVTVFVMVTELPLNSLVYNTIFLSFEGKNH